ncbi:hypothetical protein SAMN05216452_2926 [Nitratireductor aquibiodomus]|uniref:Uncharacterized protein n=1 Tax=Nitratireductor aquibiodomus TaxID=204799 RepID=A0A1H4LP79_9HYPH|nr:hypothetical protein SAMN05216452_2926 [Nitratireductor aquibiodomus]
MASTVAVSALSCPVERRQLALSMALVSAFNTAAVMARVSVTAALAGVARPARHRRLHC